MNAPAAPLFSVRGLTKHFDGIRAVDSLSFDVAEGSITGIIGPNGAGKTTVFNIVTGLYRPTAGSVLFRGESITGLRPDRVVRRGIARTFQNIRLFNRRSCLDNVLTPLFQRERCSFLGSLLGTPSTRRLERELRERALGLLEVLGLERFASTQADNLPYGFQRKLEIARALATEPSLLLLDEPAAGMNPEETRGLADLIAEVRERFQVTILLIEHHMDLVMNICSPIVVMNFGALLARGTPDEVRADPAVVAAYLGKGEGPAMKALLVEDLHVHYGTIHAVQGVSFPVEEGEIVSIVGSNGAGKSTIMWTLAGVVPPSGGRVAIKGSPMPRKPHEVVALGLALVPERRRLFSALTVRENLLMGAYRRAGGDEIEAEMERCFELFPILRERLSQRSGTLSGGEQQMLAISRALMSGPEILLLDEPTLGLAPLLVEAVMETIARIRDEGVTVLMVEQNATQALEISDRGYILEAGVFVKSGPGPDLARDPEIRRAYLGG